MNYIDTVYISRDFQDRWLNSYLWPMLISVILEEVHGALGTHISGGLSGVEGRRSLMGIVTFDWNLNIKKVLAMPREEKKKKKHSRQKGTM